MYLWIYDDDNSHFLQWKSHLAELEVEQNIQPLPKYMLYEASRLGDLVLDISFCILIGFTCFSHIYQKLGSTSNSGIKLGFYNRISVFMIGGAPIWT